MAAVCGPKIRGAMEHCQYNALPSCKDTQKGDNPYLRETVDRDDHGSFRKIEDFHTQR